VDPRDPTGGLPDSLWRRLREDPLRAPEHLALAAAEWHAPAAEAWVAEQRALTGARPPDLARIAKARHALFARLGGAATGMGGVVTLVPDLAALAWIQSRMVLFIAAAYGHAPRDRMRPAELLVLRDLYATPREARAALDGLGTPVALAYMASGRERDRELAGRLLSMLGRRGARSVAGRLVPVLAAGVNAVSNERDTRRLADRAIAFYAGR
jgi:EcsC protein family